MTIHEQIVKAIGAHGMWKARLLKAIDAGASDIKVADARLDNQCDFGKWLHAATDGKGSPHYEKCRQLHRDFHLAASKVLALALSNKKTEATHAMGADSEFVGISAALTQAMLEWDKTVPR